MEIVEPVPSDLWDRVAARCPYATFFHTRAWSEIWEKSHPGVFRSAARAAVNYGYIEWWCTIVS